MPPAEIHPVAPSPASGGSCEQYGCGQGTVSDDPPASEQPSVGEQPSAVEKPPVAEAPSPGEEPPANPGPSQPACRDPKTGAQDATCGLEGVPKGYQCSEAYDTPLGEKVYACYKGGGNGTYPLYVFDENGNPVGQRGTGVILEVECGADDCGAPAPDGFSCKYLEVVGPLRGGEEAGIMCVNDNLPPPSERIPGQTVCYIDYDSQGNYVGTNHCDGAGGQGGDAWAHDVVGAIDAVDGDGPQDEARRPPRGSDEGAFGSLMTFLASGRARNGAQDGRSAVDGGLLESPDPQVVGGGAAGRVTAKPRSVYESLVGPLFALVLTPSGGSGPVAARGPSAASAEANVPRYGALAGGRNDRDPIAEVARLPRETPAHAFAIGEDECTAYGSGGERTMAEALLVSHRRELPSEAGLTGRASSAAPVVVALARKDPPGPAASALAWVLSAAGLGGGLSVGLFLHRRRGAGALPKR